MRSLPTKRHITLWILLLLAVLSWWLQRQEGQSFQPPEKGESLVMDFSFSDFVITAMDNNGEPKHRLLGKSMIHYVDTDFAELTEPRLEVYREMELEPMTLDSERALIYQNGDSVLLQGEVVLLRHDEARENIMKVLTRDVWVYHDQEFAETGERVTITDNMGITTAKGMKLDMKAGTIELLAEVRGEYVLQ